MKKALLVSFFTVAVLTMIGRAQVSPGLYYMVSAQSLLKISPVGGNLQQVVDNGEKTKWELLDMGSGNYRLRNSQTLMYIAAPAQGTQIAGKKLESSGNSASNNTLWKMESQGGDIYRFKNVANNFYIGNLGNSNQGAPINQVATPGSGANWKLMPVATATATNISDPNLPVTNSKDYPTQWLNGSKTVSNDLGYSQSVSINYGYDVKMVYGTPENGGGGPRKYIVLETHGTQGFNPGQAAETGTVNDKSKIRGYYIESIKTEARVISGTPSLYTSLPKTDANTGSTGVSQGFSITLSGGAGVEGGKPAGGASVSIGYSFTKSSSLDWTDFKIMEDNEPNRSTHNYKLNMLITQAGGAKPYNDYKDLKNPNNLGIKPLHILPQKSYSSFPLYEWIAFEASSEATESVTIEVKAEMVVNFVKWTGTQIVQYPETITTVKQFTVNLSDVGVVNP